MGEKGGFAVLKESDREICFEAGAHIANLCIYGIDNNKEFFKVASPLTDINRKRILSEVICFRIFLAYNGIVKLPFEKNLLILKSFQSALAHKLDERYCKQIPYKIAEYRELDIGEFIFDDILRNSGIRIKDVSSEVYCGLRFSWFFPEIAAFSQTVSKILKYVIVVSKQSSQKAHANKASLKGTVEKGAGIINPAKSGKSKSDSNILSICVAFLIAVSVISLLLGAYVGAFDSFMVKRLAKSPVRQEESIKLTEEPPQQESFSEDLEPDELATEELSRELLEEKIEELPEKPIEEENPLPAPTAKKKIIPIAKNGVYTGYDLSQEILNDDGLCEFTVDNTRNDMPVYVRIWDMRSKQPVRAFNIAQGEKFTALNLSPSTYEIRYIELYENDVPPYGAKSEPFVLEQHNTLTGTTYSVMELTLYKVYGGNTRTFSISADEI